LDLRLLISLAPITQKKHTNDKAKKSE
jgi:hypothetical protein